MRLRHSLDQNVMSDEQQKLQASLDTILKRIDDIDTGQSRVNERIDRLEAERVTDVDPGTFLQATEFARFGRAAQDGGAEAPPPSSGDAASGDFQGEFQSIKDSLQKLTLPADLRLNDSRSGIKRQDQPFNNAVVKSARYVETTLKVISTLADKTVITTGDVEKIFAVQCAHIKFLQEEYQTLLVKGQFDEGTAKIFRTLQKNTSAFSPGSIETLKNASQLMQAQLQINNTQQQGRGYNYRGNRRGYRGDRYQSFSSRGFGRGRGNQQGGSSFYSQNHDDSTQNTD